MKILDPPLGSKHFKAVFSVLVPEALSAENLSSNETEFGAHAAIAIKIHAKKVLLYSLPKINILLEYPFYSYL